MGENIRSLSITCASESWDNRESLGGRFLDNAASALDGSLAGSRVGNGFSSLRGVGGMGFWSMVCGGRGAMFGREGGGGAGRPGGAFFMK